MLTYIVGGMMLGLGLSGALVLYVSLREFLSKLGSRHRFERAEGTIVKIERKTMHSLSSHRSQPRVMNLPVITFNKPTGETVTFTSEVGDGGRRSRYSVGQTIGVLFDRDDEQTPMLDSWSGVWLPSVMGIVAGVVFQLGAVLIYWAFWDKIVGAD